jgi:uncharacterized SAM-binding protein YcdF (DUF218 family)
MFFSLSKLLIHLTRPGDFLLLLLAIGVILFRFPRLRRGGVALVTGVTILFLAIAALPVSAWLTAPLENRFPRPAILPARVDGLIVLGGAVDPLTTSLRGLPTLNSEAERMTEFVRLAKRYPRARLVFSGGMASATVDPGSNEATVARLFFRQQGLDLKRVTFEARSRDTYENVVNSKALVRPRKGQTWLLVASARDMPRVVGVFRKQDWPVIAVPVAYKSDFRSSQNFAANLHLLDGAAHEWLGLAAYWLSGRTDTLFPAPRNA